MFQVLLIIQVLLGLAIIGLVLLQQGKGADMGAAFGSGASGTVFGARGGGSFFTRATGILAAAFFANSILLSSPVVLDRESVHSSVTDQIAVPEPAGETVMEETPAVDIPPADLPDVPAMDEAAPGTDAVPGDLPE